MYDLGKGIPCDKEKARRYFEFAAEKGHVWAQKEIALRMLRGEYGLASIPKGVVSFIAAIVKGVRIGRINPDDERIRV